MVDRDSASRLGVPMANIDNTLNDAFGQRQVSNIYVNINQYHVVLEVAPQFLKNPESLKVIYVPTASNTVVPLSAVAHYAPASTSLQVNHTGIFPSITLSFNLAPNASLGTAVTGCTGCRARNRHARHGPWRVPGDGPSIPDSHFLPSPYLILTALAAVYIVLGILYESYIHPITILSTLPSAGVGAVACDFPVQDGPEHNRIDRNYPADWNREEECHS